MARFGGDVPRIFWPPAKFDAHGIFDLRLLNAFAQFGGGLGVDKCDFFPAEGFRQTGGTGVLDRRVFRDIFADVFLPGLEYAGYTLLRTSAMMLSMAPVCAINASVGSIPSSGLIFKTPWPKP